MNPFEIQKALNSLHLNVLQEIIIQANATNSISRFDDIRSILMDIKNAGIVAVGMDKAMTLLESLPSSNTTGFPLSSLEANSLYQTINIISLGMISLRETLNANLGNADGPSVRIRVPDVSDLDGMEKAMRDFKIALAMPLSHPDINGSLKVIRGEPGSVWILLEIVAAAGAIGVVGKIIAELCWSAAVISKKVHEGQIFTQQVRDYKIQNDYQEILFAAQKEYINQLVDIEAKGIIDRVGITSSSDEEYTNRLKLSIKTLDELFRQGAQVRPAIGMPEDINNLFPKTDSLQLIESRIKQIAEHGNHSMTNPQ